VQLQFVKNPPIDGTKIIALVQRRKDLRLSGPEKLRLAAKMPGWPERAQAVKDLLAQLAA
jgi:transcription-repair coupling factor (superfamily II helicase)